MKAQEQKKPDLKTKLPTQKLRFLIFERSEPIDLPLAA
jgi:hypothetical protein